MHELRFLNGKLQERRQMVPGGIWNEWTDVQSISFYLVDECKCGTPEYCTKHEMPATEPKDSEVWCECQVPAAFPKCICSNCHKTVDVVNPHYVPVKTLAEKLQAGCIWTFEGVPADKCSRPDWDRLADIAHEHFKQEKHHD